MKRFRDDVINHVKDRWWFMFLHYYDMKSSEDIYDFVLDTSRVLRDGGGDSERDDLIADEIDLSLQLLERVPCAELSAEEYLCKVWDDLWPTVQWAAELAEKAENHNTEDQQ